MYSCIPLHNFIISQPRLVGLQNPLAAANSIQKERKSEKEKTKDGFVKFFFFLLSYVVQFLLFVLCLILFNFLLIDFFALLLV